MSRRRSSGVARRDRRVRPAELRERADEMAALLDEAAPRARRIRRRRSVAVPAAVAAFGALSVGGVGLALGLTPTGTEGLLPASPSPALADPASSLPPISDETVEPTAADLDPAEAGADLIRPDDRVRAGIATRPSSGRAPTSTTPRSTTTTTRTARPTRTTSTPRTTTARPTVTPRSTAPDPDDDRPTSTASARPVAERSALPTAADPDLEPSSSVEDGTTEPSED